MPPGLSQRERLPELMDDPTLDAGLHRSALAGLRRINRLSTVTRHVWAEIVPLARSQSRPLRVLDLACGGGDTLCNLAARAGAAHLEVELVGADVSDLAIAEARASAAATGAKVSFITLDAMRDPLPEDYDVLMSCLFLHHLGDDAARRFLTKTGRAARRRVVIDDLRRGWRGYLLAVLGTRLLTRSPVVHTDGPRSVRAAFSTSEAETLARAAGLRDVRVRHHWPLRFLMSAEPA